MTNRQEHALPIDAIRAEVCGVEKGGRLVLSSPTGSGKSTQVPRWFRDQGRVLVVEPRRVACRSLADRVAHLDGHPLGTKTGYIVRDENKTTPDTQVIFATPGVVLRMIMSGDHEKFDTIIIDEFHERSLDTDLLLALLREEQQIRLVIMSATLDGDLIAKHLGGTHLHAEGRLHPVDIRYTESLKEPPTSKHLERRVKEAMKQAQEDRGDILIFLPGKAEISAVCSLLRNDPQWDVLPLHGNLTLAEQTRVFQPSKRRKVIVSTNVAETSLTVPGIGVVIDSGLVRQTRYHSGRGYLSLVPVAMDSAAQRSGRAGRTSAGVCYRLWSHGARMEERTRPEVHRESLVPLLLSAAACGHSVSSLSFLSPPKPYAVDQAQEELTALGAFAADGALTAVGKELFKLPMDAQLGRLLVEAQGTDTLADMVDLVAALAVGRNLFRQTRPPEGDEDLRSEGSDALGWILAVRRGQPKLHHLDAFAVQEARRIANRLRQAFGLPSVREHTQHPQMDALAQIILKADPRTAHVARDRGKRVGWSNGGTEIEVGRDSVLDPEKWKAIAVLSSRAMKTDKGATVVLATCVLPLPFPWMVRAGLGRRKVASTAYVKGQLEATIECIYAKKVIGTEKTQPTGALAREAVIELLLRGSLFRKALEQVRIDFRRWSLATELQRRGLETFDLSPLEVDNFDSWIRSKVESIGLESGEDIDLLSPADFALPPLDEWTLAILDKTYPDTVTAGEATFLVHYELARKTVRLEKIVGQRKELPSLQYLPRFKGFAIEVEDRGKVRRLRERQ